MRAASELTREAAFMLRDRSVLALMAVAFLLAMLAVWSGLQDVAAQRATIERLLEADRADRVAVLEQQSDWGGAAYATFHLTHDAPSNFAFAAMGQRDRVPWMHRIRMLALEGQIRENDAGNPEFALIGRFDVAFLVAFVLPLLLIVLLYDIQAAERAAGRHELLCATAGRSWVLWVSRSVLRAGALYVCVLVPVLVGGWISGAGPATLLAAAAAMLGHVLIWTLICGYCAAWQRTSSVILASLVGLWIVVAVIVPAAGRASIDRLLPVPAGADIILTQREAVNRAWDLPKATTMEEFLLRHPEWADFSEIERPFEWKWYYAFQQVGDQQTEALSRAYARGRLERDRWASRLAWLSPPVLLERRLQQLAGTDMRSAMAYEERVRQFHGALRAYYYPKLFRGEPFDRSALAELPDF